MSVINAADWPVHHYSPTLDADVLNEVTALLRETTAADGTPTISEQSTIALRTGGNAGETVILLAAYVPQDPDHTDVGSPAPVLAGVLVGVGVSPALTVEVAVHPRYRNKGVGLRLINELQGSLGSLERIQAWSHGDSGAAEELATHFGFSRARELWRMRLSTSAAVPAASTGHDAGLPDGYSLRTFVPGEDEGAWLAANAAAFAHHPEQGSLTTLDLAERMAEPWFDPAGFFLITDTQGEIVGFHWTKMEPATSDGRATGEVYVVGVVPSAQGLGLGKVLTRAGLEHLKARGATSIILYVDADNEAAVKLYRGLGFTHWDSDVMYLKSPIS